MHMPYAVCVMPKHFCRIRTELVCLYTYLPLCAAQKKLEGRLACLPVEEVAMTAGDTRDDLIQSYAKSFEFLFLVLCLSHIAH